VRRYHKGNTSLDFTEARDSEWQWHHLGRMQVCTSLQTDNHTSTPPLSFFTGRMPFLLPNLQRQSTEGTSESSTSNRKLDSPWFLQNVDVTGIVCTHYSVPCVIVISNVGLLCRWSSGTTAYDAATRSVPRSWQSRQDVSAWHDDASQWQCWDAAVIGHVCRTAIRRSASSRLEILCMPAVSHILAYVVFCFSPFMP